MTSGASETIFMYCLSRSSRATGPKTRVPTGSPAVVNQTTAAFESKADICAVAATIFLARADDNCLDDLTLFYGTVWRDASLTAAVTTSPRPSLSYPVEPPSGRMTCSLRAPELSATVEHRSHLYCHRRISSGTRDGPLGTSCKSS